MKLTERLTEMSADVRDQASAYAERTLHAARQTVDQAADRVDAASAPIETLSDAAMRLNKLVLDYANELVSHQANVLTGALHDGAERLRLLNKAESMKDAYRAQVKYFDVTKDRLSRDAKTALQIVSKTGTGIRALAEDTYGHWLKKPATATRRKSARKTTASRKAA